VATTLPILSLFLSSIPPRGFPLKSGAEQVAAAAAMATFTRSLLVAALTASVAVARVAAQNAADVEAALFSDFPDVAAGFGFTSAIIPIESTLFNWGGSYPAAEEVYGGVQFAAIDASVNYQCGLRRDDLSLLCWGTGGANSAPTGTRFLRLSTGQFHACGLRFNEDLVDLTTLSLRDNSAAGRTAFFSSIEPLCWGSALSDSNRENLEFDNIGTAEDPVVSIHAGRSVTCTRTFTGRIACSGIFPGASGGSETEASSVTPTERFRSISLGDSHACGVTVDGVMQCFGGCSDVSAECVPPTGVTWSGEEGTIASGASYSCALNADGDARCWGSASLFQSWEATRHPLPTDVEFSELRAGRFHLCGIRKTPTDSTTTSGTIQCWGQCAFEECDLPQDNPLSDNTVPCSRRTATNRLCSRETSENGVCEVRSCQSGFVWSLSGRCTCQRKEVTQMVMERQINGTDDGAGFFECRTDGTRLIVTPTDPECTG